ncbi:MAG: hypothetical protein NC401_19750 [Ruminococcus sp.]|nr:hypothetical protein [Ruminococcus sp.]
MNNMTIKEAAELWVNRDMTAIPLTVVEKLIKYSDYTDICEITPVTVGNRVWNNEYQSVGEVIKTRYNDDGDVLATVRLDDDTEVEIAIEDLSSEESTGLPMWSVMWAFTDPCDGDWLEDEDNRRRMAECGFRIFESEDFGYIFGIDGAGYDFYSEHWIPLYKARGLQWHDKED